jgi:hypothetical protein
MYYLIKAQASLADLPAPTVKVMKLCLHNEHDSSGDYLYFDQGHFTLEGLRQFGKTMETTNNNLF